MSIICGGCKKDISPGAENSLVLGSNCPSCGAHFGRVGLSCIGRPGQYDVVVSGPAGSGGWRPCAGAIVPEVGTIAVKSTGSCISGQTMTMSASDSYTRKRELDEALSQLAALREELASAQLEDEAKAVEISIADDYTAYIEGRLADAERRNAQLKLALRLARPRVERKLQAAIEENFGRVGSDAEANRLLDVRNTVDAALNKPEEAKCCTVSAEDQALLDGGDYTPEELFGIDGKPSCPKCSKPTESGASE